MRSLLLAASLVVMAPAAMAQGLPPGMPTGIPGGIPLNAPERPIPRPLPPLPSSQEKQAEVGTPAPMPLQPAGGFTLPTGGAAPVAQNLSGAPGYARTLQDDGARRLSEMTGNSQGGGSARLDPAPIANQSDLEAITNGQRNIVTLKQQVEEAKLAVELWHVLYNNDDAKTLREKQEKATEAKAKEDKERDEKAQAQAATVSAGAAMASAMRTVDPSPPKVIEVNGSRALLLVPSAGEVWVRSGDTVAGGWKVNGVMPKGVRVTGPKGKMVLGYGDSIGTPAMPMPSPMPQTRPPGAAPRI